MKFTELTVKEYDNFVQNPALESHYFQVKENIATREEDGFQVVLLGLKDDDNQVIAASLFSKIPTMGSYVYYSNRGPVMDYKDLGLVDFYLRELDTYLQKQNCLYVKWILIGYTKFMIKILIQWLIIKKMMRLLIYLNLMDIRIMGLQQNMIHQVRLDGWVCLI